MHPSQIRAVSATCRLSAAGPPDLLYRRYLKRSAGTSCCWKKEHHRRFHTGESLLPMNLPILERLGVRAQVEQIGMPKYGAHFFRPSLPNKIRPTISNAR